MGLAAASPLLAETPQPTSNKDDGRYDQLLDIKQQEFSQRLRAMKEAAKETQQIRKVIERYQAEAEQRREREQLGIQPPAPDDPAPQQAKPLRSLEELQEQEEDAANKIQDD